MKEGRKNGGERMGNEEGMEGLRNKAKNINREEESEDR